MKSLNKVKMEWKDIRELGNKYSANSEGLNMRVFDDKIIRGSFFFSANNSNNILKLVI